MAKKKVVDDGNTEFSTVVYNPPMYPLSFSCVDWKNALGLWLSFGFLVLWLPGALFASTLMGGRDIGLYRVGDKIKENKDG